MPNAQRMHDNKHSNTRHMPRSTWQHIPCDSHLQYNETMPGKYAQHRVDMRMLMYVQMMSIARNNRVILRQSETRRYPESKIKHKCMSKHATSDPFIGTLIMIAHDASHMHMHAHIRFSPSNSPPLPLPTISSVVVSSGSWANGWTPYRIISNSSCMGRWRHC